LEWVDITRAGETLGPQAFRAKGLAVGTSYVFCVRQRNDIGWSAFSPSSPIVTTTTTLPPTRPVPLLVNPFDAVVQWEQDVTQTFVDFKVQVGCLPPSFGLSEGGGQGGGQGQGQGQRLEASLLLLSEVTWKPAMARRLAGEQLITGQMLAGFTSSHADRGGGSGAGGDTGGNEDSALDDGGIGGSDSGSVKGAKGSPSKRPPKTAPPNPRTSFTAFAGITGAIGGAISTAVTSAVTTAVGVLSHPSGADGSHKAGDKDSTSKRSSGEEDKALGGSQGQHMQVGLAENVTQVLLQQLAPGSLYVARVKVRSIAGWSGWSEASEPFRTPSAPWFQYTMIPLHCCVMVINYIISNS
jgi:hypothetical protein